MDILQNIKLASKIRGWISSSNWSEGFLLLYVFTLPFVSAFAFTGTISLPLLFALLLFFLMVIHVINVGKLPSDFLGFDIIIIILFLLLLLFSFAINGWGNPKSVNHTIAYLSTFLLFYISVKFTLFNSENYNQVYKRVLQIITYTTCISAIFTNLEFISVNFFDLDLNEYIPRAIEGEELYNPTVIGLFIRARGFATESGHFSLMMELFSPLSIYYMYFSGFCKWVTLQKIIVTIAIFFSFLFAASSASFIIIPIAFVLSILLYSKRVFYYIKKHKYKVLIALSQIALIFIVFNYFLSLNALILLSLTDKLNSESVDDRQERIDFFYNNFFHLDPVIQLFGVGPAGYSNLGFDESKSILSLYYKLTFEIGFLGLLLILLFILYVLINTIKIKKKIGFFLMISVISGVIHYYFISNYWYPWFWFIAAFAIFCNKKFRNE